MTINVLNKPERSALDTILSWVVSNNADSFVLHATVYFTSSRLQLAEIAGLKDCESEWVDKVTTQVQSLPEGWERIHLSMNRYLYTVVDPNSCSFCLRSLNNGEDHSRCSLILFECQGCGQSFNSVSKRRSHTCCPENLEECAVHGLFRIYSLNLPQLPSPDYLHVLFSSHKRLVKLVEWLFSQEGSLKIYLAVHIIMHKLVEEDDVVSLWFNTTATEVIGVTDISHVIMKHILSIDERVERFMSRGSGWIIKNMLALHLKVTPYRLSGGGSYLPLPEELKKYSKSLLNVENNGDDLCFLWAVLASEHHLETVHPNRKSFYKRFLSELDFRDLKFPMPLKDIPKFERSNGMAINVFGYKSDIGFYTEYRSEFVGEFPKTINLLYLRDLDRFFNPIAHYVTITNLPNLLTKSKNRSQKYVCVRCHTLRCSAEAMERHEDKCANFGVQKVKFPPEKYIEFDAFKKTVPLPVWVILDLESCLVANSEPVGKNTKNVSEHVPCSYSFKVCSDEYPQFDLPAEYYVGADVIEHLLSRLDELYHELQVILDCNTLMTPLTPEEEGKHETAVNCHICLKPFQPEDTRVKDHQHHPLRMGQTSNYIGPAHVLCNMKRSVEKKLVVIAHNMSGYDLHLFIKELCDMNADRIGKVHLLPQTIEKYISLSTPDMIFIDSMRHLQSSLDSLVQDLKCLGLNKFHNVREYVHGLGKGDNEVELLTRKSIFCYDYMTSLDVLSHPIPPREQFHNSLTNRSVDDGEWSHLQSVVTAFDLKTVGQLLKLYNTLDTLLTADVWSNYRSWALEFFGLEPGLFVSGPGICWQAVLKRERPKLAMLKDADAMMLFESGIRGGITCVSKRYAEANNPDCPDFDPSCS